MIGFTGHRSAGKTFAEKVVCANNESIRASSFAEILRECLSLITGRPVDALRSLEDKNTRDEDFGMTYGQMLQRLGTDAVRDHFHQDTWIIAARRRAKCNAAAGKYTLMSDVRFPNELNEIIASGGVVMRIELAPDIAPPQDSRDDAHVSETGLDDYVLPTIVNNTTHDFGVQLTNIFNEGFFMAISDNEEAIDGLCPACTFFEYVGTWKIDETSGRKLAELEPQCAALIALGNVFLAVGYNLKPAAYKSVFILTNPMSRMLVVLPSRTARTAAEQ